MHVGPECDEGMVCECCANCHYTCVYASSSRRAGQGDTYWVKNAQAVRVGSYSYDIDNLPDYIRELHDGEYAHEGDCVWCERYDECRLVEECVDVDGEWYLRDDDTVVECADDVWRLRADCWQCAEGGEWYSEDEEYVTADGKLYHPDVAAQWAVEAGQTTLDFVTSGETV
jgi:hypothetical protein